MTLTTRSLDLVEMNFFPNPVSHSSNKSLNTSNPSTAKLSLPGGVLLDKKGIQSDKSHGIGRIKAASFAAIKDVLEKGTIILPLDYYATNGKKQMTGMMAAPIVIGTDSFICVVVVIYNLQEKRLYLHECFLTEKIPEIAASSLVRGSSAASPQSQGSVAKILQKVLKSK